MPSNLPRFTIRTEQDIIDKITYIASEYERSGNQEIVYLIKQRIKEYESEHGQLIVGEDGSISLAKPKILGKSDKSSNSKIG
ncbi:MAG: hypothetical protein K0Q49_2390 [Haloplasmataceae bacterium]|jgi:hypothetical protein|nr:hypothetical protein [Haloplasmataceae bacterium]